MTRAVLFVVLAAFALAVCECRTTIPLGVSRARRPSTKPLAATSTATFPLHAQPKEQKEQDKEQAKEQDPAIAPAGLYMLARQSFVDNFGARVSLSVANDAGTAHIPTISGNAGGVSYQLSNWLVDSVLGIPSFSSPSPTVITVLWPDVVFFVEAKYSVQKSIISESGLWDVTTVNTIKATATVELDYSGPTVTGSCTSVALEFNQGDVIVNVYCTSDICLIPTSDIANAIAQEFVPTLTSTIQKAVTAAIAKFGPLIKTTVPLVQGRLDLSIAGDLQQLGGDLLAVMKGEMTLDGGKVTPPFAPTLPSVVFPAGGDVGVFMGDYLFQSSMWAEATAGLLAVTVTNAMIPPSSPVHLTPTDPVLLAIAPGLASYASCSMKMIITLTQAPQTLHFSNSAPLGQLLTFDNATMSINFMLLNATVSRSAFAVNVDVSGRWHGLTIVPDAKTKGYALNMSLGTHFYAGAALAGSSVGPVDVDTLLQFVDLALVTLSAGVSLPLPALPKGIAGATLEGQGVSNGGIVAVFSGVPVPFPMPAGNPCGAWPCPVEATCCNGGCCPLPQAVCCGGGCCPNGSQCVNGNQCYEGSTARTFAALLKSKKVKN